MKKSLFTLALIGALLCTRTVSFAQVGTLDLTFNSDGQLGFLDFPNSILPLDILETDGQIFALLTSVNGGTDSFILKLTSTGEYDTSYGTGGVLTLPNIGLKDGVLSANNDRLFVVATVNSVFSIAALDLQGNVLQEWTPLPISDSFTKMVLDQEENIVIATSALINNESFGSVVKFTPQLEWIFSYGTNGVALTPDANFSFPMLEIDSQNRVVLATRMPGNIWRFNEDGTVDTSFDYSLNVDPFFLPNWILDIAVAPDNGIYVQPNTYGYPNYLFKINAQGSAASNFGQQGHIILEESNPNLIAFSDELLTEPGGGLIVMGSAFASHMEGKFLARLDANGQLDTSFEGGPHGIDDNGYQLRINFHCATLQEDGRVLSMDQIALWQGAELEGFNVLLTRFNNNETVGLFPEQEEMQPVVLFPNPSNGMVQLQWPTPHAGAYTVSVYNSFGAEVSTFAHSPRTLFLENLASGIYTVCIYQGHSSQTFRMLKTD